MNRFQFVPIPINNPGNLYGATVGLLIDLWSGAVFEIKGQSQGGGGMSAQFSIVPSYNGNSIPIAPEPPKWMKDLLAGIIATGALANSVNP